jgi:hypothetical protein
MRPTKSHSRHESREDRAKKGPSGRAHTERDRFTGKTPKQQRVNKRAQLRKEWQSEL